MKTFSIQTLGCKVNHYEGDQIAQFLRLRGLEQVDAANADLRVVNTCSVTTAAASQSRQAARRVVRLPQISAQSVQSSVISVEESAPVESPISRHGVSRPRVVITGCWATSDRDSAKALAGVDAVIGHHDDVAAELDRLLTSWQGEDNKLSDEQLPGPDALDENINGWMALAGTPEHHFNTAIKPSGALQVNSNLVELTTPPQRQTGTVGARNLPLLGERQASRQRAFLKIQDGCDAHCTYCIIPSLRPALWSKPVDDVVEEAKALVGCGHVEIILTGIFLGAYGQPTALRRRQPQSTAKPLGALIKSLCTKVPGLRRLRLSSLEPGDLTNELVDVLRSHPAVVPHFHLPLQSGSDHILRRMNRQYTSSDFLQMVDRLRNAFDRPALTTDVVVGFPGETDDRFDQTAAVVARSEFIHVHAFPYSARPGTAAARWGDQFVHGPVRHQRIERLQQMAEEQSIRFRNSFDQQIVEVIVERDPEDPSSSGSTEPGMKHGRCERYFSVYFENAAAKPGDSVPVRITRVAPRRTFGEMVEPSILR